MAKYWTILISSMIATAFFVILVAYLGLPEFVRFLVFIPGFSVIVVFLGLCIRNAWRGCPRCGYPISCKMITDEKTGIITNQFDIMLTDQCTNCDLDLTKPYEKDK